MVSHRHRVILTARHGLRRDVSTTVKTRPSKYAPRVTVTVTAPLPPQSAPPPRPDRATGAEKHRATRRPIIYFRPRVGRETTASLARQLLISAHTED